MKYKKDKGEKKSMAEGMNREEERGSTVIDSAYICFAGFMSITIK